MKAERLFSVIGLIILAYMLGNIGISRIAMAARAVNPVYMAGFFSVFFVVLFLKGFKWMAALRLFGIRIGMLSAVRMWAIGFSLGAITPGRVGDFAKIFYLKEKKSRSLGAVFLDRLTDVFAVALFAVLSIGVFGRAVGITYWMAALAGTTVVIVFIALKKRRKAVAGIILQRIVPEKHRAAMKEEMSAFYHSLKAALSNRAGVLAVAATAVFIWMLSVVQGAFIAKSLGINISYYSLLSIMSITALIELIPVTVAGLGTREAGIVLMMSYLGIESEKAIVFSLANFLFGYLGLAALGYALWLRNPIKMDMKKES